MNRSQGVMAGAVRTRVTWAARFGWVSLLFMTCAVQPVRADLGLTNMRLTATLLANSCSVSTGTQEQTVELGTWPSKQFAVGSQSPNPTRFEIVLENCGVAASGVEITFHGSAPAGDSTLLALNASSSATNVAVAILDSERRRLPLGQPTPVYTLSANAARVPLVFYGQYVAIGTPVTVGSANADATFTLTYQ
ncbi:fimbrial protein [Pectobacterium aroidearum]|uniref:fimbrial protein n=1 Tax=Pectobacterium aroidearum TaxID=1201031 RepID=UPI0021157C6E|nr:fimbrial protein [Pectobacterium aroidearum]UUE55858.1 fimbrial protein [Pectobacterium aroidearum]UUE68518.1 fimbrial protein [Pectobacterium aroidearum]UUE72884.1 fimbrial protein [Pectobacterium aroidearum]UUE77227.1 fimbrial protein [Pectobacterium aroidearum]